MEKPTFESRYEYRSKAGSGAQGEVFKVFDRIEQRIVAIKTISPYSPQSVYELKREFRAISETHHPHLVQLYDLYADGETAYFTMEYIEGGTIVEFLRPNGELESPRLKPTFAQLVLGIDAIHRANRIHRDLKPSNVMVETDGRLVILDFGLVVPNQHETRNVTNTPGLAGTWPYMPPEAFEGEKPAPSWDWYGLGAILYEVLVGEHPFAVESIHQLIQDKNEPHPGHPALGPWRDLVLRALDPNPQHRPGKADFEAAFEVANLPIFTKPRFLGREQELGHLVDQWEDSGPRIAAVSGVGGIGKSALIAEFALHVQGRRGGQVLTSRCRPNETVAFEVFDGLVDGLSRTLTRNPMHLGLDDDERTALTQLFPVLRTVVEEDRWPDRSKVDEPPAQVRRRAAQALRRTLNALARRAPLLILIEDVHWASPDSSAFFNMVFGPGEAYDPMVVLSFRPELDRPMVDEMESWRTEWPGRGIGWQDLVLSPLPPGVMTSLLEEQLAQRPDHGRLRNWIAEQSGGNPYLAEELCRAALASPEPLIDRPVEQALLARVDALTTIPRGVLTCAAVSGRALHRGVLVRCADDRRAAERSLGELLAQRFLRDVSAGNMTVVDVYHDRLREAVDRSMSSDMVRRCHSRLADALEETNADPRELVSHLLRAERREKAAEKALDAAEVSRRRLEFETEARFLSIAIEHGTFARKTRQRYEKDLAAALANAGRGAEAAEVWLRLSAVDDPSEARFAERKAAALYLGSGHIRQGYEVLSGVLVRFGMRIPTFSIRSLMTVLWIRLRIWTIGYRLTPPRHDPNLKEHADVCWEAAEMLSMVDTVRGSVFQARNMLASLRLGDRYRLARALGIEAAYLGATGMIPWARCEQIGKLAVEAACEGQQDHGEAIAIGGTGVALYFHGRWRESLAACEQADDIYLHRCVGVTWERDTTTLFMQMCLLRLGRLAEAEAKAREERQSAIDRGDLFLETYTNLRIMAPLLVAHHRLDEAQALVDDAMRRWSTVGYQVQEFWAAYARTLLALFRNDGESALAMAERTLADLRQSWLYGLVEFRVETMAHAARACLLGARSDDSRRLARARGHIKSLSKSRVAWPRAYAQALSACLMARQGRTDAAVATLAQAGDAFDALEMPLDAALARHVCGRLQGGDEGRSMTENAERQIRTRTVVSPQHYADVLFPALTPRDYERGAS